MCMKTGADGGKMDSLDVYIIYITLCNAGSTVSILIGGITFSSLYKGRKKYNFDKKVNFQ